MNMTTRLKSLISILLLSSAIFMVSVPTASAGFIFEAMVTASLDTITVVVLGLSTEIGFMADRILVMADNIVTTEQMLADITTNGVTCK